MVPRLSQELAHVLVLHRIAPGRGGRRYAFDVFGTGEGRGRAAPPPTGRYGVKDADALIAPPGTRASCGPRP